MYHFSRKLLLVIIAQSLLLLFASHALAQFPEPTPEPPLTSQELVKLVYQLPKNPDLHDQVVDTVRKRGIGFPLTDGMRTLVAAKSGNDAVLRRTLEEAERRRANPKGAATLPPPADARDLLERCRTATLAAADAMPDFVVKQQIARYYSNGNTKNWHPDDTLSVAVGYRPSAGEEYKLLTVNGVPPAADAKNGSTYEKLGGTTSTGEYVSRLALLFSEGAHADFKPVDTDLLRGRPTLVYEFDVQKQFSSQRLIWGKRGNGEQETIVGSHGRIWIDREKSRVLRIEVVATDIDQGFPITASSNVIDYDWVAINDNPYLLPTRSILEMSFHEGGETGQTRNDIRFRGYQKYGSELKIIDDDDDVPPEKPDETKKPDKPRNP